MFVKEKFKNIKVEYILSEDIEAIENKILIERFKEAKTIKGTQSYHSFEPLQDNNNEMNVRKFSLSDSVKKVKLRRTVSTGINGRQSEMSGRGSETIGRGRVMGNRVRGVGGSGGRGARSKEKGVVGSRRSD